MPRTRAPLRPVHKSRVLRLEALELRAVPAALAQMVELNLDPGMDWYDAVDDGANGLIIAGTNDEQGRVLNLRGNGEQSGAITLTPLSGFESVATSNLSEDGHWLIGSSYTRTLDANGEFVSYRSALTLWRLSDPAAPIAVDVSSLGDAPLRIGTDISNEGTFVGSTPDGRLFLAGPTGLTELSLPPGTSAQEVGQGYFKDISADGRVFIGSLHLPQPIDTKIDPWGNYLYQAALWRDGQPQLLEVDPAYISSNASAVSDDGRLIGGSVLAEDTGHVPAVWFDGHLQTLKTAAGEPMRGNVGLVINGIDGDPAHWLAFGVSYHYDFGELTFVAGPDGIARPLSEWLHTNYGFEGDLTSLALIDAVLANGELRLFSSKNGFNPRTVYDNPLIKAPTEIVPTGTQMITIDLDGRDSDVNSDGQISPIDVLLVINALNAQLAAGTGDGSLPPGNNTAHLDVNRDGLLSAADALVIINRLNANLSVGSAADTASTTVSEGESASSTSDSDLSALAADAIFRELAAPRRR